MISHSIDTKVNINAYISKYQYIIIWELFHLLSGKNLYTKIVLNMHSIHARYFILCVIFWAI
jgi:hypothetical protein